MSVDKVRLSLLVTNTTSIGTLKPHVSVKKPESPKKLGPSLKQQQLSREVLSDKVVEDARTAAQRIVSEARRSAFHILEEALHTSDQIMKEAQTAAESILKQVGATVCGKKKTGFVPLGTEKGAA